MNERKTETLVRKMLTKLGYYKDNNLIIEEQKSDLPSINKLLKNASKKGDNSGHPEFIIRSKTRTNFLIVIECKANIKYHESPNHDRYSEFAVDGVLLYSSFLSKEFDVLGIAVSGQDLGEIIISQHLLIKNSGKSTSFFGNEILSFEDYYNGYINSEIKFKQDYEALLDYTRRLNEVLHGKKIKESQRGLLISGILIALQNEAFKSSYTSHQKSEQLAKNLLTTIVDEFTNANLPADKVNSLKQAFSFVSTSTTLTTDKVFFESLIKEIDENVNNFMRTHKYFDTLGQFYIEFLRYANNDKGLGIVLTPPHITDLFAALVQANKNSIIYDNCCGTGGFLISAMKRMVLDAKDNAKVISKIKNHQLCGVEYQDDIYALGVSNMIIHGDGKTNILPGDCFELSAGIKKKYSPNIGLLNPPYKSKKSDIEEFDFVLNNLNALQPGGRCIAIIPLSCAISTNGGPFDRKKLIMKYHTLEAVMSMPEDLFHNSKVNVVTCAIMVTAHKPHPKGKKTWLGYWRNDGFEKVKSKGRIDLNNTWAETSETWINAFINREVDDKTSLMVELKAEDEWCIEAYLKTDYSVITKTLFKETLKKYLAYRLLNDLLEFFPTQERNKSKAESDLVPTSTLFFIKNGVSKSKLQIKEDKEKEEDIRFIRPSQSYIGSIDGFIDKTTVDSKYIFPENTIYVSTDGQGSHTFSYVSSFEFVPNSNCSVLIPKKKMSLTEKIYYSICITVNRYKYSYGRKPKGDRLKNLQIPSKIPPFVYEDAISSILDEWSKILLSK